MNTENAPAESTEPATAPDSAQAAPVADSATDTATVLASTPVEPAETSDRPAASAPASEHPPAEGGAGLAPDTSELEQKIAELEARAETQAAKIETARKDARRAYLERLNVKASYHGWAPDVDPFTDEGKAALAKWADDHPEVCMPSAPPVPEFDGSAIEASKNPNAVLFSLSEYAESKAQLKRSLGRG